jgi:hypothetical protein
MHKLACSRTCMQSAPGAHSQGHNVTVPDQPVAQTHNRYALQNNTTTVPCRPHINHSIIQPQWPPSSPEPHRHTTPAQARITHQSPRCHRRSCPRRCPHPSPLWCCCPRRFRYSFPWVPTWPGWLVQTRFGDGVLSVLDVRRPTLC